VFFLYEYFFVLPSETITVTGSWKWDASWGKPPAFLDVRILLLFSEQGPRHVYEYRLEVFLIPQSVGFVLSPLQNVSPGKKCFSLVIFAWFFETRGTFCYDFG